MAFNIINPFSLTNKLWQYSFSSPEIITEDTRYMNDALFDIWKIDVKKLFMAAKNARLAFCEHLIS